MPENPTLVEYRKVFSETAIIFIHGFRGNSAQTWGEIPKFIAEEKGLKDWDIFSLGYATSLRLDLVGLGSADPPLHSLADLLRTAVRNAPLDGYKAIALVAHSMGGLVVQRALVDDRDFVDRIDHVVLFGTPSGGLLKAGILKFLKRQFRDMDRNGKFIKELRAEWTEKFGISRPF
jgi:pimeloyl-ACP methyl ester carboxylesterase